MGVSGLVSQGSPAAGMFVETADRMPPQGDGVVGVPCVVRMPCGPVGPVITRSTHAFSFSARATVRYGGNSGGPLDVDTVGVPGDWGYR